MWVIFEKLTSFYVVHNFISEKEKNLAAVHCLIFRNKVLKVHGGKSILNIHAFMLKRNNQDLEKILLLLEFMLNFIVSTAVCERAFSRIYIQKKKACLQMFPITLSNVIRLCIAGPE